MYTHNGDMLNSDFNASMIINKNCIPKEYKLSVHIF